MKDEKDKYKGATLRVTKLVIPCALIVGITQVVAAIWEGTDIVKSVRVAIIGLILSFLMYLIFTLLAPRN